MGRKTANKTFWFVLVLALAAACGPERDIARDGAAVLLSDVTLAPATLAPTRVLSPTPSPVVIPVLTSELNVPLNVVTFEADFVMVTPTLPPSKTPTLTATATATYTATSPPTATLPPLPASPTAPPAVALPPSAGADVSIPPTCGITWFFARPVPAVCPLNPPLVSAATFQQFEKGFMVWVQQHGAIYVLYDSANFPRWSVYQDAFREGMPETDPAFGSPPAYTWQPRRGFGLVWRTLPDVRQRLGWAVSEWEQAFTIQIQTGADGTIYMSEPRGGVFGLSPDGSDWKRYEG
jgi:hypothetical protein